MRFGLDYAEGRPGYVAIRAAGFDFVVRYLSSSGPSSPGKVLTPAEADDSRAHQVSIAAKWETAATRMLDGYGADIVDARAGLAQVLRCGGRADRPSYFSADFDATPQDQQRINAYLDGAATVLGSPHPVGFAGRRRRCRANVVIYSGFWSASRALDAGSARWARQADAWSGGNIETRRSIHRTLRRQTVGGVVCDVNVAEMTDFGQWDSWHRRTRT